MATRGVPGRPRARGRLAGRRLTGVDEGRPRRRGRLDGLVLRSLAALSEAALRAVRPAAPEDPAGVGLHQLGALAQRDQ